MPGTWPDKDPDDVLDYGLTITGLGADDYIVSTTATVLTGTVVVQTHAPVANTTSTITRLMGGAPEETASVRIRSQMASGQRVDQTMTLKVAQR